MVELILCSGFDYLGRQLFVLRSCHVAYSYEYAHSLNCERDQQIVGILVNVADYHNFPFMEKGLLRRTGPVSVPYATSFMTASVRFFSPADLETIVSSFRVLFH